MGSITENNTAAVSRLNRGYTPDLNRGVSRVIYPGGICRFNTGGYIANYYGEERIHEPGENRSGILSARRARVFERLDTPPRSRRSGSRTRVERNRIGDPDTRSDTRSRTRVSRFVPCRTYRSRVSAYCRRSEVYPMAATRRIGDTGNRTSSPLFVGSLALCLYMLTCRVVSRRVRCTSRTTDTVSLISTSTGNGQVRGTTAIHHRHETVHDAFSEYVGRFSCPIRYARYVANLLTYSTISSRTVATLTCSGLSRIGNRYASVVTIRRQCQRYGTGGRLVANRCELRTAETCTSTDARVPVAYNATRRHESTVVSFEVASNPSYVPIRDSVRLIQGSRGTETPTRGSVKNPTHGRNPIPPSCTQFREIADSKGFTRLKITII